LRDSSWHFHRPAIPTDASKYRPRGRERIGAAPQRVLMMNLDASTLDEFCLELQHFVISRGLLICDFKFDHG
jgi:hypothetical protein